MKHSDVGIQKRVTHEYLGDGVVTEIIRSGLNRNRIIACMVLFDTDPPTRYNLGQNPCMVFLSSLTSIGVE